MNFTKEQLNEINRFYELLAHVIVKNNKWGKKLPEYVKNVLDRYNLILDLIEDIEELNKRRER